MFNQIIQHALSNPPTMQIDYGALMLGDGRDYVSAISTIFGHVELHANTLVKYVFLPKAKFDSAKIGFVPVDHIQNYFGVTVILSDLIPDNLIIVSCETYRPDSSKRDFDLDLDVGCLKFLSEEETNIKDIIK